MRVALSSRTLALAAMPLAALADVTPSDPRLATKEEYLACLVANSSIEAKKARLTENDERLKARAAKFQAAEADLTAQVKKHTPSTKAEIDSYNKAVAARNASAQSLNKDSLALQQEQAVVNKLIVDTNAQCGSLLVSPEVAQAAQQEHRKIGEAK